MPGLTFPRKMKSGSSISSVKRSITAPTVWHLNDGSEVVDSVAHELTRHRNIQPADDKLPLGGREDSSTFCQTYHFVL
jgi:hypothetical protein